MPPAVLLIGCLLATISCLTTGNIHISYCNLCQILTVFNTKLDPPLISLITITLRDSEKHCTIRNDNSTVQMIWLLISNVSLIPQLKLESLHLDWLQILQLPHQLSPYLLQYHLHQHWLQQWLQLQHRLHQHQLHHHLHQHWLQLQQHELQRHLHHQLLQLQSIHQHVKTWKLKCYITILLLILDLDFIKIRTGQVNALL